MLPCALPFPRPLVALAVCSAEPLEPASALPPHCRQHSLADRLPHSAVSYALGRYRDQADCGSRCSLNADTDAQHPVCKQIAWSARCVRASDRSHQAHMSTNKPLTAHHNLHRHCPPKLARRIAKGWPRMRLPLMFLCPTNNSYASLPPELRLL